MNKGHVSLAAAGGLLIGVVASPAISYAATYFSTTTVATGSGSASCPYGSRVTGGGADMPRDSASSYSTTDYKLVTSHPTTNGWSASGSKTTGSFSSSSGWRFSTYSYTPRVYAVCAR